MPKSTIKANAIAPTSTLLIARSDSGIISQPLAAIVAAIDTSAREEITSQWLGGGDDQIR